MKKLPKKEILSFNFVRLYLQDIQNIENILNEGFKELYKEKLKNFKKELPDKDVSEKPCKITVENYVLESSNELKDIQRSIGKDRITDLTIEPSYLLDSTIRLSLDARYTYLHYNRDDIKELGMAQKIREILEQKRNNILFFISKNYMTLQIILIAPLIYFFFYYFEAFFLYLMGVACVLFITIFFMMYYEKKQSIVYLYNKSSKPNFILRNKDRILSHVIGGIITTIIGIIIGKYLLN